MESREKNGIRYVTAHENEKLIEAESDINKVIEASYEHDTVRVLLHKENLPAEFTKLASGQAGAILHKFSTYHMKLAVVMDAKAMVTGKFAEMVNEANAHNRDFHVFSDAAAAEKWLTEEN